MRLVPTFLLVALAAGPLALPARTSRPVHRTGLPPRSVPEPITARPVPEWTRTHFRVGHLPGSPAMAAEFLKAGYNVIILNALGRWDAVGPSAKLHPPEKVREAEGYLCAHVEKCHKAGAKAIFYVGPVQVPVGNPAFVKAHPDWLRVRPTGSPIRPRTSPTSAADTPTGFEQLAYVIREFKADGFWFDGYRARPPAHLRRRNQKSLQQFSGGKDIPLPMLDVPDRSMSSTRSKILRPGGTWPGTKTTSLSLPTGCGRRFARRTRRPSSTSTTRRTGRGTSPIVHGRIPSPLLRGGGLLVRRALLGRAGRPALSAVRLRLHAGDRSRTRGDGVDSAVRSRHFRECRLQSRSSSAGWRGRRGE